MTKVEAKEQLKEYKDYVGKIVKYKSDPKKLKIENVIIAPYHPNEWGGNRMALWVEQNEKTLAEIQSEDYDIYFIYKLDLNIISYLYHASGLSYTIGAGFFLKNFITSS